MIKINEVRIGNILKQGEVFEICGYDIVVSVDGVRASNKMPIEILDVVLLTPEILESIETLNNKTGYGTTMRGGQKVQWDFNYQKVYLHPSGSFYFVTHTDDFGDFEHGIILKSLHQLQNLYFALTGEELQIKELCFVKQ